MKQFLPIIMQATLFSGVEKTELSALLHCLQATTVNYEKGEYILRCGDTVTQMGLLLSGSALIVQEDFWGNCNILTRVLPGQLFAETFSCVPGTHCNVSVTAEAPVRVLWLDVRRLMTTCPSACAHHNRMIHNLVADLAAKNLRFNEKLTHMSQRTTREKLLSYLSAEAQRQHKTAFAIPFTRQQLADYLAVERSAMSAELGKLRRDGVLDFKKQYFILKNKL